METSDAGAKWEKGENAGKAGGVDIDRFFMLSNYYEQEIQNSYFDN